MRLGSKPELPADTCKEIKLSEGEQLISGYYWFLFERIGEVILAFCDIQTEGITKPVILRACNLCLEGLLCKRFLLSNQVLHVFENIVKGVNVEFWLPAFASHQTRSFVCCQIEKRGVYCIVFFYKY